ncbi:MAG: histidine--tRNA ligase [Pirellulaceae bacterium]|jgi:histidyl-tRNA synthetase|nr:histidine--tRNA ligase [Pirellulaceae bacterium]
MIDPRILSGFRDYLPEAMMPREQLIETARRVYRSYGFAPIDTPALEYREILLGKGSEETDRQLYLFEDHGGRQVGMRFDLTVPLARFVAQHIHSLGQPFKRYHVGVVWRGERAQRGRYREFMQCDFDTIGTTSVAADIETALVINDLFEAIGFDRFQIHLNNRQLLNGLLEKLDMADQAVVVLRALDKLAKIGRDRVAEEMTATSGASVEQVRRVLEFAEVSGENDDALSKLEPIVAGSEVGQVGLARLTEILAGLKAAGVPQRRVKLDVSIARGLDYYTGAIFETFLDEMPEIGSVCSGGRYDDLANLFTKQQLPGVGASLGLDRLLAAMEALGKIEPVRTPADVLIPYFDAQRLNEYLALAAQLRAAGLGVEVYPDPKKLGQQLKYASERGFRAAVIAGEDEFSGQRVQVKDLAKRTTSDISVAAGVDELVAALQAVVR